jgi:hypothetical protein
MATHNSQILYGSPAPAAATKIQALVRGQRDRTEVNEYITILIEELLRSKAENSRTPQQHQLQSKNNTLLDDEEEEFKEEEFVVLIEGDGDYDDDEEMETVVEITFVDCEESSKKADKSTPIMATTTTTDIGNSLTMGGVTAVATPTSKFVTGEKQQVSPLIQKKPVLVLTTTHSLALPTTTTMPMPMPMPKNTQSIPPPSRQRHKSALVNRYLEAAAKLGDNSSSKNGDVVVHKLEIEKDSRLAATATARFSTGKQKGTKTNVGKNGIDSSQQEQEHVQEKCITSVSAASTTSNDEDAIVKIQALVRGMLERREVAKYVMTLIEEMLIETTTTTGHNISGERDDDENQPSSGNNPVSEIREIIETKEEEQDEEPKEDDSDEYDETDRLPLWWMKYVPHDTYSMEEYENNNDDPTCETDGEEEINEIIDIVYRPLRTKDSSINSTKRKKSVLTKSSKTETPMMKNSQNSLQ